MATPNSSIQVVAIWVVVIISDIHDLRNVLSNEQVPKVEAYWSDRRLDYVRSLFSQWVLSMNRKLSHTPMNAESEPFRALLRLIIRWKP